MNISEAAFFFSENAILAICCAGSIGIAKSRNNRTSRVAFLSVFDTKNSDIGNKGMKARNSYKDVLSDKSQFCKKKDNDTQSIIDIGTVPDIAHRHGADLWNITGVRLNGDEKGIHVRNKNNNT